MTQSETECFLRHECADLKPAGAGEQHNRKMNRPVVRTPKPREVRSVLLFAAVRRESARFLWRFGFRSEEGLVTSTSTGIVGSYGALRPDVVFLHAERLIGFGEGLEA